MLEKNIVYKLPNNVKYHATLKLIIVISLFFVPLGILVDNTLDVFLLCFIFFGLPILIYRLFLLDSVSYQIHETNLEINKGIFVKKTSVIPFEKIQNIDLVNTPLLSLFNLTIVKIWTASPGQVNLDNKKDNHPEGLLIVSNKRGEKMKELLNS